MCVCDRVFCVGRAASGGALSPAAALHSPSATVHTDTSHFFFPQYTLSKSSTDSFFLKKKKSQVEPGDLIAKRACSCRFSCSTVNYFFVCQSYIFVCQSHESKNTDRLQEDPWLVT